MLLVWVRAGARAGMGRSVPPPTKQPEDVARAGQSKQAGLDFHGAGAGPDKVGRDRRVGPERQLEEELAADGDGGTGSGTSPNALGIKPLTAYTQLSSAPRVTDRIRLSRTAAVMTCRCDASGEKTHCEDWKKRCDML